MTKKFMYCPKCKTYPDTIIEEEIVITRRAWDEHEQEYTTYDTDEDMAGDSYCPDCDVKLEYGLGCKLCHSEKDVVLDEAKQIFVCRVCAVEKLGYPKDGTTN